MEVNEYQVCWPFECIAMLAIMLPAVRFRSFPIQRFVAENNTILEQQMPALQAIKILKALDKQIRPSAVDGSG